MTSEDPPGAPGIVDGDAGAPRPLVPAGELGSRFWGLLVLVLLVAASCQLVQVQRLAGDVGYDGPKYLSDARDLADGKGFISSDAAFFAGVRRESAVHPPAHAVWLSLGELAGWRSAVAQQRRQVVLGVAAVLAIVLATRLVAGDRAALLAGALAAVHPAVWSYPAMAMAETTAQACVAVAVLCTLRWWREPSIVWAAGIGGAAALAALTRSELLVLLVVLVAALRGRAGLERAWRRHVGAAVLWAAALLLPWVGFNLLRFEEPVLIASGVDTAIASANCDATYEGPLLGGWSLSCRPFRDLQLHADGSPMDESEEAQLLRSHAVEQMRSSPGRLPVVVGARVARTMAIWDPDALARVETFEHRERSVLLAANAAFLLLVAPAAAGARRLRRAGWTLAPVLATLLAAVLGSAITQGSTRYRAGLDVVVVLLAAVALDGWWRSRSNRAAGDGASGS